MFINRKVKLNEARDARLLILSTQIKRNQNELNITNKTKMENSFGIF